MLAAYNYALTVHPRLDFSLDNDTHQEPLLRQVHPSMTFTSTGARLGTLNP